LIRLFYKVSVTKSDQLRKKNVNPGVPKKIRFYSLYIQQIKENLLAVVLTQATSVDS
jgi:hypothetical protein